MTQNSDRPAGESLPSDQGRTVGKAEARRRTRIYLWMFTTAMCVIAGLLLGILVLPPLADRHYLGQVLTASGQPHQRAQHWWVRRIRSNPAKLRAFAAAWRGHSDDAKFLRMADVLIEADRFMEQPASDRLRHELLTRLARPAAEERARAVRDLPRFAGDTRGLADVMARLLKDPAVEVLIESVAVLPAWSDQEWAVQKLVDLLFDERVEVRQKAALACGLIGDDLTGSAVHRSAALAIRRRLIQMAIQQADALEATYDPDVTVRANACWSLWRLRWMARSALELVSSASPPEVRRLAVLILTNPPILEDHTDVEEIVAALDAAAISDDALTRQRAILALSLLGVPDRQQAGEWVRSLLTAKSWPHIALGCRVIGLADLSDFLPQLHRLATTDRVPDPVNEQVAFALGRLAQTAALQADRSPSQAPPAATDEAAEGGEEDAEPGGAGQAREKSIDPAARAQAARQILALLSVRSGDEPTTQPAGLPAVEPKASPRTRLAAAVAWGHLGVIKPLVVLAGERLDAQATEDGGGGEEILADMACLELARLAAEDKTLAPQVAEEARRLLRGYDHRQQRSGALLLGLLRDAGENAFLRLRWESERRGGAEILTAAYFQIALLMLGEPEAENDLPAVNWLNDQRAHTPGVYAGLILSGQRLAALRALDELLLPDKRWAYVLLDGWHLRDHLADWVAGPVRPLPAADAELADFQARMAIWWYRTHRDRLRFDPRERNWQMPLQADE